jgi:hypothetical protein
LLRLCRRCGSLLVLPSLLPTSTFIINHKRSPGPFSSSLSCSHNYFARCVLIARCGLSRPRKESTELSSSCIGITLFRPHPTPRSAQSSMVTLHYSPLKRPNSPSTRILSVTSLTSPPHPPSKIILHPYLLSLLRCQCQICFE